jgi:hypothetical protein
VPAIRHFAPKDAWDTFNIVRIEKKVGSGGEAMFGVDDRSGPRNPGLPRQLGAIAHNQGAITAAVAAITLAPNPHSKVFSECLMKTVAHADQVRFMAIPLTSG